MKIARFLLQSMVIELSLCRTFPKCFNDEGIYVDETITHKFYFTTIKLVVILYAVIFRRNVEDQMKKVEEMGVEMPKYYRPGAVNPVSYAEQVQKRKMLWKKPGTDDDEKVSQAVLPTAPASAPVKTSFNKWEATNFGDEGTTEKFRRLMGIKAAPKPEEFQEVDDAPGTNAVKIMSDLEKNYEQARQQTHRNRGIGLGFSSSEGIFNSSTPSYPPGPMAGPHRPQMGPASVARPGYGINFVKKN